MALDWSRILSGVGQGLMQAGQPGANLGHFGSGLMQGTQAYDAGVDRKEDRAFRQWQQEQAKAQAEEQRLAHTKAAEEEQAIQNLINGVGQSGPMQPGGVQTASGGLMQGGQQFFDPATLARLRALPPSLQRAAVEQQLGNMFAAPKERKTSVVAGQLIDDATGETIRDLTDAEIKLRQAGAANTRVDVHAPTQPMIGTIPEDMVVTPDGKGGFVMSVIPGSKTATAGQNRDDAAAQTTDVVTTDINRTLEQMDNAILPTTGMAGNLLSGVPNTASHDVSKLVLTIKGNIGIDKLQAMRMQSPTGGALGNVTEGELATLQSTLGNLEQSQSDEQFRENLKRVYNLYLDTVHGKGMGGERYPVKTPKGPDEASGGGELRYDSEGNPM